LVLAISTNDALSGNARNIGSLMARRHIYFVPLEQDDAEGKPSSAVADLTRLAETLSAALEGRQIQPILG
jgi:dipicolinate synthase subunit B